MYSVYCRYIAPSDAEIMLHSLLQFNIFLFAELVEEFKVFEGWSTALLVRVGKEFMWRDLNA